MTGLHISGLNGIAASPTGDLMRRQLSSAGIVTAVLWGSLVAGSLGCGAQAQDGSAQDDGESPGEVEQTATGVDVHPSKDAYVRAGTSAGTNFGTSVDLTLKG